MSTLESVRIESMAFKGYGVARVGGRVVFIPYSVTGDEARIEIVEEKKNYSFGRLEALLVPSPWRTEPPCPYFRTCGGCQWQHIEVSNQAQIKRDILQDVLRRLGGVKEVPPVSITPSPRPYGYRARVQLKVAGETLGYYQAGSHRIVDIDRCPISHPLINRIISILRPERSRFSSLREIEIRISPEEERGVLVLQADSLRRGLQDWAGELLRGHPVLKGIVLTGNEGSLSLGEPLLTFSISVDQPGRAATVKLRASPKSFFQVNLEQNQALVRTVQQFGKVKEGEKILDLYAGIGNFSLPLGLIAGEVVGIEENGAAVEDARFNAGENRIGRCRFLQGRTEELLKNWKGEKPDLVVLDPPRAGGRRIVDSIAGLAPKRIVYVSCDPATLSRDLRFFGEHGYPLQGIRLIDMFPQTYHMEVVALLKPQNRGGDRI